MRAVSIAFSSLFIILLAACAQNTAVPGDENSIVYCANDQFTAYPDLVSQMLPDFTVKTAALRSFRFLLEYKAASEAFDPDAYGLLKTGAARFWYPQYLATVVIAVDRDMTGAQIKTWSDLLNCREEVGIFSAMSQIKLAAIARGVDGEKYTLKGAARILAPLYAKKLLVQNSFKPAVLICYDYQAVQMIKEGRNLEIIIPSEGTFSYEKGLLSNTELEFQGDTESLLLSNGFRLLDGRCDDTLYPDKSSYNNAYRVSDYDHFGKVSIESTKVWRRTIFRSRLYTSVDGREHQLFALLYIAILVLWTASVIQRAMIKGVRLASLLTAIIMFGWISARLIKYQMDANTVAARYFWYSYYLFQLALPMVLLWLAWVIDKPDGTAKPPKWLGAMFAINALIAVMVFTNDLHLLVFTMDINSPTFSSDYGYGIGYNILLAGSTLPLIPAVILLLKKGRGKMHKYGFFFALVFCVLLAAYTYGYMNRIPIAWESDRSMFIGMFALLFAESLSLSGAVPVNTKYAALFTHSPLSMRITDNSDAAVFSSANVMREEDENTLHFSAPISGGQAQWQEDISKLNLLHRDIEKSVKSLGAANALLAEEEKIQRTINEEKAKAELTGQLEAEISGYSDRLSKMIEELCYFQNPVGANLRFDENSLGKTSNEAGFSTKPIVSENQKEANLLQVSLIQARIALLLCYIKRRCNLFFRERETALLPAQELAACMNELAEVGAYSGVKTLAAGELKDDIPVRHATLFYDFLYSVIDWADAWANIQLVASVSREELWLRYLRPADDGRIYRMENDLREAVKSAGGVFSVKDLDDSVGIGLVFAGTEK